MNAYMSLTLQCENQTSIRNVEHFIIKAQGFWIAATKDLSTKRTIVIKFYPEGVYSSLNHIRYYIKGRCTPNYGFKLYRSKQELHGFTKKLLHQYISTQYIIILPCLKRALPALTGITLSRGSTRSHRFLSAVRR